MPLIVTPALTIPDEAIEERFVRASGPGGQNVNKVATAVELRFDAARSPALDDAVRERLRAIAGRRMTAEGVIVIDARRFRTQAQNREDARERLAALVGRAPARPATWSTSRPRRPTRGSRRTSVPRRR